LRCPTPFKTARYRCKWTHTATAHIIRSVTQTIPPAIFPRRHDWTGRAVGYWNTAPRASDFVRQEAVPAPAPGQPTARAATTDSGRHGPTPLLITFFPAAPRTPMRSVAVDRRKLGDAARSADTGPVRAQPDGSGATDAQRLRRSNRRILRPGKYGASAGVALYSESSIHLSDLMFSHMRRRALCAGGAIFGHSPPRIARHRLMDVGLRFGPYQYVDSLFAGGLSLRSPSWRDGASRSHEPGRVSRIPLLTPCTHL
jgi:hypothetical protein